MNLIIDESVRYPAWTRVWQDNAAAVNEQILDCYHSLEYKAAEGDGEEQCRLVQERVKDWFDQQPLDEPARSDFEQIKSDPDFLSEKVKDRIRELMDEGRFEIAAISSDKQ